MSTNGSRRRLLGLLAATARRKIRLRRPSPGTVLGGLALVVAMSGVAVAAPGSDGTITACIAKGGGLTAIDGEAGATCPGNQQTVKLASTDAAGKVANADKLDGIDSTALDELVDSGKTFGFALAPLAPGACRGAAAYTGAAVGKMVVASTTRDYAQQGITVTGNVVRDQAGSDTNVAGVTYCNVSNADVPGTRDMPIFWAALNAP